MEGQDCSTCAVLIPVTVFFGMSLAMIILVKVVNTILKSKEIQNDFKRKQEKLEIEIDVIKERLKRS